jgi:hypothetical protein
MLMGFVSGCGEYAAIPYGKELMVIYRGQQIKLCRTEASAKKFIANHKKGKSVAELPVE